MGFIRFEKAPRISKRKVRKAPFAPGFNRMKGGNFAAWLRKNITDPFKDFISKGVGTIASGFVPEHKKKQAYKDAYDLSNTWQSTLHDIGYKLGESLLKDKDQVKAISSLDDAKKKGQDLGVFDIFKQGIDSYGDKVKEMFNRGPGGGPPAPKSKAEEVVEVLKPKPREPAKPPAPKPKQAPSKPSVSELQERLRKMRQSTQPREDDIEEEDMLWGEGKKRKKPAKKATKKKKGLPPGVYRDPVTGLFTSAKAQAKKKQMKEVEEVEVSGGRFKVLQ